MSYDVVIDPKAAEYIKKLDKATSERILKKGLKLHPPGLEILPLSPVAKISKKKGFEFLKLPTQMIKCLNNKHLFLIWKIR